jgi:hypothetical protein
MVKLSLCTPWKLRLDWRYSAVYSSTPLLQASSPTSTLLRYPDTCPVSSSTNPPCFLLNPLLLVIISAGVRGRVRRSRYKVPGPGYVAYVFVSSFADWPSQAKTKSLCNWQSVLSFPLSKEKRKWKARQVLIFLLLCKGPTWYIFLLFYGVRPT